MFTDCFKKNQFGKSLEVAELVKLMQWNLIYAKDRIQKRNKDDSSASKRNVELSHEESVDEPADASDSIVSLHNDDSSFI